MAYVLYVLFPVTSKINRKKIWQILEKQEI